MPGGGIEWGEHPDAAVLREMAEETGISEVRGVQVAAIYSHTPTLTRAPRSGPGPRPTTSASSMR
jgi:8-oxo-dGTP diphosphatase